jgi:formylglycine-generating enzyme required for sulfatase activity
MPKMSGIFISYRREESGWSARSLYDRLIAHFAPEQIFMDIDGIPLGVDFVKTIEKRVSECDMLIAVIGKDWLTFKDEQGVRRLDNPEDFVRMEIATALKREIRIIPVLVDGALMPRSTDLPDDLKPLVRRNALQVSNAGFNDDYRRLEAAIEQVLGPMAPRPVPPPASPPSGFAPAPPKFSGKRKLPPLSRVMTLLALVIALAVGAAIYLGAPPARTLLEKATKDHPWENSLGMKFVPVAGAQVLLFSIWDTRVQDFEKFVKNRGYDATGGMYSISKNGWKQQGATWKDPGFSQGSTHPVVGVSWNDAEEFCKWLTTSERKTGDLPGDREYRLPKDEEWSAAVGLKNEVGRTPEEKSGGKIELYPWDVPHKRDKSWPPPAGAGNYAGEEAKIGDWPSGWSVIEGYNDGYPRTSPVESFSANQFGLYDMGGNVWQWCEDSYNAQMNDRALRGASWDVYSSESPRASYRHHRPPAYRVDHIGFRCVVAVESSR